MRMTTSLVTVLMSQPASKAWPSQAASVSRRGSQEDAAGRLDLAFDDWRAKPKEHCSVNVPVPGLVPDTIEQWRTPGVDDEILARHGAVLGAAAHAAKIAGLTTNAVEHRRASLLPFPYEYYLYETGGNLRSALYQLAGPGRRRQRVAYDPRRIADIAGWLTDYLGPLAYFEVVEQPIPAEAETASSGDVSEPAPGPIVEVELPAAAVAFRNGIVPPDLRAWSRERRRGACVSQEAVARRIGISRPQLANAEAGRFGLSTEAAARFLAAIAGLPERQTELRFLKREQQE